MNNTILNLPGTSKGITRNPISPSESISISEDLNIINIPYDHSINVHNDGLGSLLLKALSSHPDDSISHINAETKEEITYDQYYKNSVNLALYLLSKSLQSTDIVAVYAPNVIETDYIFCATQFIGSKISPIGPEVRDISYVLKRLKPKLLFCWYEYISKVEGAASEFEVEIIIMGGKRNVRRYVQIDDFFTPTNKERKFKAVAVESVFNTAVILFNTNSGRPKPVEITHYGLIVQNRLLQKKLKLDRLLIASPISWIISLVFLITFTVTGSTKICLKKFLIKDYMAHLDEYRITCSILSPYEIKCMLENLRNVKKSKFGRNITRGELFMKIKKIIPDARIKLLYSVTENSGFNTLFESYNDLLEYKDGFLSCGYGLPGMSYKIVDIETEHILGANMFGEIRIKSDTIMNGYYKQVEATVEAFDLDGYFCTKDLGFYDENYAFYVTDRIQVEYKRDDSDNLSVASVLSLTQKAKKKVSFRDFSRTDEDEDILSIFNISVIIIPNLKTSRSKNMIVRR